MDNNLDRQHQLLEPATSLAPRVIARVRLEERRRAKRRTLLAGLELGLSGLCLPLWLAYARAPLNDSGWMRLASLAFSDGQIILQHGYEYCLAMLEILPVWSIASLLLIAAITAWSVRSLYNTIHNLDVINSPLL